MSWKETDPLNLWKGTAIQGGDPTDFKAKNGLAERYGGTRSQIWMSLTQLTPKDQQDFLHKLVGNWPYAWERRAFHWPMHVLMIESAAVSVFAAGKINADVCQLNKRLSFREVFRSTPRSSLFFAGYAGLLSCFGLSQMLVQNRLIAEEKPCDSCILTRNIIIALSSGIIVPCVSLPYLAHYNLTKDNPRMPQVTNMVHLFTLSFEGSRSMWPHFKWLIPLQIAVATVATYFTLWGRSRIFDTMDADPDFVREAVRKANESESWKAIAEGVLSNVPLIGQSIQRIPDEPETKIFNVLDSEKK
ncbi:Protein F55A12.2 c [Aphelenchoides avenae]|nr:Protein F55A12.2 c [Aphelenchus avenae]